MYIGTDNKCDSQISQQEITLDGLTCRKYQSIKQLNSSLWLRDGALTGTTNPGQSEPESTGNERVFHIFQSSRTGTSPSDAVKYDRQNSCHQIPDLPVGGVKNTKYSTEGSPQERDALGMTQNYIFLWSFFFMGLIDLFKNYSYSIGIYDTI